MRNHQSFNVHLERSSLSISTWIEGKSQHYATDTLCTAFSIRSGSFNYQESLDISQSLKIIEALHMHIDNIKVNSIALSNQDCLERDTV